MAFSLHRLPDRADCARRIARILAREDAETRKSAAELEARLDRLRRHEAPGRREARP
jgi:hypothetical protein